MPRDLAPVALFAFRRPDHLARTMGSLAANPEAPGTRLTVFCDGPRDTADEALVDEVRRMARAADGFASVTVIERDVNLGLARNVISGVTRTLEEDDRVVVLEDDMVVSPDFLAYMNQGLDMYADEPSVISLHGYVYPTQAALPDYFFLRGADCWGWATWRRGWALFEPDGQVLLDALVRAGSSAEFDFDGAFPYTQMLRDQIAGRVDSWAVRWYASAFLAGSLTLYPGSSLVENIGLDGSGTHSLGDRGLATQAQRMRPLVRIPVEESRAARLAVADALRQQAGTRGSWLGRLRDRVLR